MSRLILCGALAALVAFGTTAVRAEEIGTEIDLSTFGEAAPEIASVWDDIPLQEVAVQFGGAPRRFYASAMLGPSFANVWSPARANLGSADTVLAAGGALGVALERARGRLRLEVEGTGRDTYDGDLAAFPGVGTILTSNWSVLGNLWRDFMLTDRFGMYAGGGIGGGGYVLSDRIGGVGILNAGAGSAFAWQGGGGLLWEVTERLTFDVGYRYFRIDTINRAPGLPSGFGANELMFTLRLYEPFRRWDR
jgi:opacity protein-like surface antigen